MSDIWLGTMNNIVNSYNAEWDKYPLGSRAKSKIIEAEKVAKKLNKECFIVLTIANSV